MKTSRTDEEWQKWGNRNPYFGVLGVETSDVLDGDALMRFLETGASHISDIITTLDDVFGGPDKKDAALDFGCGVGRLLGPLAARFKTVHAIDISPAMLDLAQGNTARFDNIRFHRDLETVEETFDFVHSFIVLQHIRPEQGMPIIEKLIKLLRPGGVFALHVTTGDSRWWRGALNWMRYRLPPLHWAYNIVRHRPVSEPITEMNNYVPFDILEVMKVNGFDGSYTKSVDQNGHRGIIFFGKKKSLAKRQA